MLFKLFSHVTLTHARGLVMIVSAYEILAKSGLGRFETEMAAARKLYDHFIYSLTKTALKCTSRASNSFSRCDPVNHKLGETYEMFTELLQGHLELESDMNERMSCSQNCAHYTTAEAMHCFSPTQQICGTQKRCHGTLRDCQ
ncbi:uncharacterized protein LOC108667065 [Hyalella azteca]|uniref:Uncharacterized protein LOC108667065 n=1 Tax=Hyalella azteca TaxID=294128 RepID=A0A979FRI6_HYAAZ|nr:uncharacterized protein LOC108667065 [Hyalella azteca]